ncbi:type IV pilus secretin PilQ [Chromatium okenii]|uniref:type IV pilus secretin PilQ n=1 Tax=Chromatium okenii TaxID=61644 RepID=UPI003084002C
MVHVTKYHRWLVLLIFSLYSFASAQANELISVQPSALQGNQVQIQLTFSAPVAMPKNFSIQTPARIMLDFTDVTSKLERKSMPIGVGAVHSLVAVTAVENGSERTRVVLNLTDSLPYKVSAAGNQVTVLVNAQNTPAPVVMDTPPAPNSIPANQAPPRATTAANGAAVRDINFRRGNNGEGSVVIRLPNANTRVAVREEGTRVLVDLYDTTLPKKLFRRLDVTDFATPVTAVETRANGRNVLVEIQTSGDFDHMAYQTDDVFTLAVRQLTQSEKDDNESKNKVYGGERVTFEFQNIEVRRALYLLSEVMKRNMIVTDTVVGEITLKLSQVPSEEALDILLRVKNLSMRDTGSVILVAPAAELAAQEQMQAESTQKIEELAPLKTEYIQINYAKAADISAFLTGGAIHKESKSTTSDSTTSAGMNKKARNRSGTENMSSMESDLYKGSILTPGRGSATFDERTNTLVIMDTAVRINEVKKIVARLDVPVRQVLIESRVVIANNDFARDLGVRFGVSGSMGSVGNNELMVAGGQNGSLAVSGFDKGPFGLNLDTGTPYNSGLIDANGNQTLVSNLPVSDPSGAVNFLLGKVGSYLLQLELSAMQREGRGEIVSSPRVITSDQSQASIKVGQEIPYKTVSDEGTKVEFKPAVLQLDVTPHITPDDRVIMDLLVSKDSADYANQTTDGVPINTRSVKTSVLVSNGETVVLGGVFERQKSFQKEQVPWLGDVPVLGRLFKSEARLDNNNELLIFVTPKILKGDMAKTGKQ